MLVSNSITMFSSATALDRTVYFFNFIGENIKFACNVISLHSSVFASAFTLEYIGINFLLQEIHCPLELK